MSEYCKNCEALKEEIRTLKDQLMETKTFDLFAEKIMEKVNTDTVLISLFQKHKLYKQALDDIEKYCNNQISLTGDLPFRTTKSAILDIISKAKGEEE